MPVAERYPVEKDSLSSESCALMALMSDEDSLLMRETERARPDVEPPCWIVVALFVV